MYALMLLHFIPLVSFVWKSNRGMDMNGIKGIDTSKSDLFDDKETVGDMPPKRNSKDLNELDSKNGDTRSRQQSTASVRYSVKERLKVTSDTEDPLSQMMLNSYEPVLVVTKENLSIRKEDEARIVSGLHSAAKKQTTGSIYSVVVDLTKTGSLGIGVKDLADSVLAVSMLKRENCCPGAGEDAGKSRSRILFYILYLSVPTYVTINYVKC